MLKKKKKKVTTDLMGLLFNGKVGYLIEKVMEG